MPNTVFQIRLLRRATLVVLWLVCLPVAADWHTSEFDVMGTRASVELWSDDTSQAKRLFDRVEAEMRRIEQVMSPYIESSELSAINRLGKNSSMALSGEMYAVLANALEYSVLTQGAFDISYASAGKLYDYRAEKRPASEALQASLPAIGYQHIKLAATEATAGGSARYSITLARPGMRIDLGGIAKGYAVDRSIAILRESNIQAALVSAGGDTRLIGNRGVNRAIGETLPWVIGIKHPRAQNKQAFRLPLSDTAISTSGDYERYFEDGERRFHHIIHPSTGESASGVVSTTVIGPESMRCDALSTSVFVMGVEQGITLIDSITGYDAIIIDSKGKVHYSSGMQGL